jgi:predicted O-methyltransferase YrrM
MTDTAARWHMDVRTQQIFAEYAARAIEEGSLMQRLSPEEGWARRDDFLLPVGENTGTFLCLLIRSAVPRTILELGTSYGYSTLYLADAARAVGARVISVEVAPYKSQYARDAIGRAGLAEVVDFHVGNALELIPKLHGPFDLVLVDLWKELYVPCLELFYTSLNASAIVVADNMIYPEQTRAEAEMYQRRVRELGFESILLPIGAGLEISRKAARRE